MKNPSPKIRDILYTVSAVFALLVLPTLGFLVQEDIITAFWVGLVGVINAGIFSLAKFNIEK